ncbi:MAG: hypothetical protein JSV00_10035 [bacterium]|nr:MAG: hypothetical protein JSV00_10035 [bacterium]
MQQIMIYARSEAGEPHQVVFTSTDDKVAVTCDCPAGKRGELCPHKVQLASNDLTMLYHPGQHRELLEAHMWVIQSRLSDLLLHLIQLRSEAEPDGEAISAAEAEIAAGMREGI